MAFVLSAVAKEVRPGVAAAHLNNLAENLIKQKGALSGFKGYQNYPAVLCVSINEQIVHGVPTARKLVEGDIVGLDLGVIWPPENCGHCAGRYSCVSQRGMYTDAALTVGAGKISRLAEEIIQAAKDALRTAIEQVKPGKKLSAVSAAIEQRAKQGGFSVIRELVGHGVGYELHEEPEIPNFKAGWLKDVILKEGMTLAIEPMLAAGSGKIKKSKDGYAYETADKSLSAHFEHTVLVTADGGEILTV